MQFSVLLLSWGETECRGKLTGVSVAGAADLAFAWLVADAVAVDGAGSESLGAGLALSKIGAGREGLVLTHLQLTGEELVQVAGESAGGEEGSCGEAEGMHFGGTWLLAW